MDAVRRVLIGVCGGIGAYKIPFLVRMLRKKNCEVKLVLTPSARTLVGQEALAALSGNPVYLDGESRYDMDHIRLSEWTDSFIIAPATANTIAKIAAGIGDNLLTTLCLSIPEEKITVAPAMNTVMWENKATKANIAALGSRGISVLPVGTGPLACGTSGPGRMLEIEEIAKHLLSHSEGKKNGWQTGLRCDKQGVSLTGKRVLISSGPTEEPLDPVRVITNRSSGKMGAALAEAAIIMGAARVTVVSGPASEPLPRGAEVIPVRTALEMQKALVEKFPSADLCIMAAAVSDYRPLNISESKLHRSEEEIFTLELAPNPDILAGLGASKSPCQFLAGFSLESGDEISRAEEKMKKKRCDMMVFNRADTALGGDSTAFTLLFKDGGKESFPVMGKLEAAQVILAKIIDNFHRAAPCGDI
ncbi:MAG: bifunctional phosphopantothenoylcysteine decarboxylase/phosphopantothenate--cysteine ligase CoaBC [Chitinispirillales bacterium]|jgi:phosphopantothenoylcysteine decarboxylase/phosphopantothenate--cysteine ligase|nr:bifunctional phosphopantothenoylcysteine decarboxylase/phosphopantothenate--cysteine ligase CoaBC [Chitinispirillales bacterium]